MSEINGMAVASVLDRVGHRQVAARANTPQVDSPKNVPKTVEIVAEDTKSQSAPIEKIDLEQRHLEMRETIEKLNEKMLNDGRALGFTVDEKTGHRVMTVKDVNTGEIIRQIPAEEILKFAHNLDNLKGMLHNKSI